MKSRLKLNSDEAIKLWSTTFFYSTKKKKKLLKEGKGETSDERANRNVDILRDFCHEQNIKYFYDIKDLSNFKVCILLIFFNLDLFVSTLKEHCNAQCPRTLTVRL